MDKPQQILRLDPSTELTFYGNGAYGKAFSEVITSKLRLENPSERIVFFKVKTTAPKHYCVRPNSGVIKPGSYAEISVLLQPVDDPSILEREGAKHKFMIQSAFSATDNTPVDEFWKTVSPADVMDSKLRVVFNSGNTGSTQTALPPPTNYKQPPSPTPAQSKPQDFKAAESDKDQTPSDTGAEIRRRHDNEKKALEDENRKLQNQISLLRQQQQSAALAGTDGGIPMIQVALLAFAMLLIGLILGKMF